MRNTCSFVLYTQPTCQNFLFVFLPHSLISPIILPQNILSEEELCLTPLVKGHWFISIAITYRQAFTFPDWRSFVLIIDLEQLQTISCYTLLRCSGKEKINLKARVNNAFYRLLVIHNILLTLLPFRVHNGTEIALF